MSVCCLFVTLCSEFRSKDHKVPWVVCHLYLPCYKSSERCMIQWVCIFTYYTIMQICNWNWHALQREKKCSILLLYSGILSKIMLHVISSCIHENRLSNGYSHKLTVFLGTFRSFSLLKRIRGVIRSWRQILITDFAFESTVQRFKSADDFWISYLWRIVHNLSMKRH